MNILDNTLEYSTIVVGSGIAGLYTSLKLAQKGYKIALLTKAKLGECNTRYAQGGVAVVMPENKIDSVDLHVQDTLVAGAGLSDKAMTELVSQKSGDVIKDLIHIGVPFDKNNDQKLEMTMEGAHSVRRILHAGGDATGENIEKTLVKKILDSPNIDLYEQNQAVELLVDEKNTCIGIVTFDNKTNSHKAFLAQATVLATGGLCQVYLHTTNPSIATGDGVAMAYNAGATIQDMEFIQFHPTALSLKADPQFLISEAVRGEGAKLRNIHGDLFALKYDKRGELAPRDVVARAIFAEMEQTQSDHVFLDATHLSEEKLKMRFPTIFNACLDEGINISKDFIPVSPAAHYAMGGIKVDSHGQTNLKNLFAVGEVACTGLHGANRLASNSLLECVVLANEAFSLIDALLAEQPQSNAVKIKSKSILKQLNLYESNAENPLNENIKDLTTRLKETMWKNAGLIRNENGLKEALNVIQNIEKDFNTNEIYTSVEEYELRNLLIIAKLIVKSAIERKESRGAHYRTDFQSLKSKAEHSYMRKNEESKNAVSSTQVNFKRLHTLCY